MVISASVSVLRSVSALRRGLFSSLAMPPKKKKVAASDNSKPTKRKQEDLKEEDKGSEPANKVAKTSSPKVNLSDLDFSSDAKDSSGRKWNFKISTWNVAGLRAWLKKEGLDYVKKEDADIICFQETKCSEKKLPPEVKLSQYHTYWANAEKEGYSGVALYSKEKPIKVTYGINKKEHDKEGRVITAEFEKFYLVTAYVPNAGQGLKTLSKRLSWDIEFRGYLKKLDADKPVVLCGDLNVAHHEIDLANPKTNTKSAGFTQEERDGMTSLLAEGFVDTFRNKYPDAKGAYTFWTYFHNARAKNTGWRLDYFVLSERLAPSVCDVVIRKDVYGSDHCPLTLLMHL